MIKLLTNSLSLLESNANVLQNLKYSFNSSAKPRFPNSGQIHCSQCFPLIQYLRRKKYSFSKKKELILTFYDELISKYNYFIFDCDGVLYEGTHEIEKAMSVLNYIQSFPQKKVFLYSNISVKTRTEIYDKITNLGGQIQLDKVFTTSYLTAQYVKTNFPDLKTVYLFGSRAIKIELLNVLGANIKILGSDLDNDKTIEDYFNSPSLLKEIQVVIGGGDLNFNYYKLAFASKAIHNGASFIVTSTDPNFKQGDLYVPGVGPVVNALIESTGKQPMVIGKPNPYAIEVILNQLKKENINPKREEILMTGDTIQSDIAFAHNSNIHSCLVLSGCTTPQHLQENSDSLFPPTYISPSISYFSQNKKL
jgi:HAD superfamily hydrolase (TIGR01450 family)